MKTAEDVLYAIQDAIDKKTDVLTAVDKERLMLRQQNTNSSLRVYEFQQNNARIHAIERQIEGIEHDLRGLRIAEQIAENIAFGNKVLL